MYVCLFSVLIKTNELLNADSAEFYFSSVVLLLMSYALSFPGYENFNF